MNLDGSRTVSAREFHIGPYETVVGPGEMLTEIRIPIRPGGGSAYQKVGRRVGDWPVGAAARRSGWTASRSPTAGIGLTAVGAEHFSAPEAEEFLRGAPATEESFAGPARSPPSTASRSPTSAGPPTTSGTWPAS